MDLNSFLKSFEINSVSAAGKARLLEMIALPRSGELSLLVIPPLMTLYYINTYGMGMLIAWPLVALALAASMHSKRRQSLAERDRMSDEQWLERWVSVSLRQVTMYGGIWALPLILLAGEHLLAQEPPPFEFCFLTYTMLASNLAICTNSLTSMLRFFERYIVGGWIIPVLLIPWMFPHHWLIVLPLGILYGWIAFQHARRTHGFLVRQVQLEESSTRLAEQFKEAKEEAESALKAKNQFLATASHDLRQPVHAMSMLIEAISQRNQDTTLTPALTDLRSSLKSMNLMFNSLLDLSKLESGVLKVERKHVHLQPFLQGIAKMFEYEAQDRQLKFRLHLPKQAAFAHTDTTLLRQILLNLTQNAFRYTQQGGVLLAVRKRGSAWQIEVCDTGIGVAEESQSDIYLPYFRQRLAWGIDSEGHGLGLSVVARCALLLKSPLDMSSRLGHGSRFWIRVPNVSAETLQISAGETDFARVAYNDHVLLPINQGRCLIVEDDPQVSRAWHALMQSWAVEVRIVSNSAEAFACLNAGFAPQAILCDERLRAGESGFELLKALMERLPKARGAMVSGEFNAPSLAQAEEEGFLVLRKPVDIGFVHDLLSRWLQTKQ